MKRVLFLIIAFAITASAVVFNSTVNKKDVHIYMRSGNWNTGDRYSTMPVIVNGKVTCPYVGSIFTDPYDDGKCPDVNIYHLVRVAQTKKGLDCYYDYTVGMDYMISIYNQKSCPDVLAAYDGLDFFRGVYFDAIDNYKLYYPEKLLAQSFDGDFDAYPRVKEQIRYRRINMRKDKKNQHITFGD